MPRAKRVASRARLLLRVPPKRGELVRYGDRIAEVLGGARGDRVMIRSLVDHNKVVTVSRVIQTMGGQFTPLGAHSASFQLQKSWPTRQVSQPRVLR
jgi:hypothetical protein